MKKKKDVNPRKMNQMVKSVNYLEKNSPNNVQRQSKLRDIIEKMRDAVSNDAVEIAPFLKGTEINRRVSVTRSLEILLAEESSQYERESYTFILFLNTIIVNFLTTYSKYELVAIEKGKKWHGGSRKSNKNKILEEMIKSTPTFRELNALLKDEPLFKKLTKKIGGNTKNDMNNNNNNSQDEDEDEDEEPETLTDEQIFDIKDKLDFTYSHSEVNNTFKQIYNTIKANNDVDQGAINAYMMQAFNLILASINKNRKKQSPAGKPDPKEMDDFRSVREFDVYAKYQDPLELYISTLFKSYQLLIILAAAGKTQIKLCLIMDH